MPATPCTAKLQTPPEQQQVHYISDNVYVLGTLSCAVCGHAFPIHSNAWQRSSCSCCGTLHEPGTYSAFQSHHRSSNGHNGGVKTDNKVCSRNTSAALFFTEEEVTTAMAHIRLTLGKSEGADVLSTSEAAPATARGLQRMGATEVDNRIIEEAFCETCGAHTPCKTFARQTRSADEGQTIFFQCTKCNFEWQQNS